MGKKKDRLIREGVLQATPIDASQTSSHAEPEEAKEGSTPEDEQELQDGEFRARNFSNVQLGGLRMQGEQNMEAQIVEAALAQDFNHDQDKTIDGSEDSGSNSTDQPPARKRGTLMQIGSLLKQSFSRKKPAASAETQEANSETGAPVVPKSDPLVEGQDHNLTDYLDNYQEFDMGQIDEEERPFMIVDKDTGKVYDIRNEQHVDRLTDLATTTIGTTRDTTELQPKLQEQKKVDLRNTMNSTWSDWWRQKKRNNQEYFSAAEAGNLDKCRKYLNKEIMHDLVADINFKGLDQWTALHSASNHGHLNIVEELLKQPSIVIDSESTIKRTALHLACIRGHSKIVKALVSRGANPNHKDFDESTPLHCASEFGQLAVIKFLILEGKANPQIRNKFGYIPSDISLNLETRSLFNQLVPPNNNTVSSAEIGNPTYGRTAFNGVLMHNDRINSVQRLLAKHQMIGKQMGHPPTGGATQPQPQQPVQTEQTDPSPSTEPSQPATDTSVKAPEETKEAKKEEEAEASNKRWKQKFIKLWQEGEKRDKQREEEERMRFEGWEEDSVGPEHFKIISKLGQGSFGQVYVVEKLNVRGDGSKFATGNLFAMKILNKKQIMGHNLVKYAKTERDVLTYTSHPFIVGLKYAFQTPEKLFLLLDYAAGGNMSRALHKDKRFKEDRAKKYLAEVLLAIEDLHKRDIIYRDLKPDNIVFDSHGHALVTDFGLSKENVADDSCARSFCGSPAYLAPEMLRRSGHGKSVDWYLLGVLLYEMLVGIPPYYSNNKEQLYENIQRGPLKLPNFLSDEARSLLIALLNRNPHKRLGAGPNGPNDIRKHAFFKDLDWEAAANKELEVPPPYMKRLQEQDVNLDKVYGRGAFEESLRDHNRLHQWSFVKK